MTAAELRASLLTLNTSTSAAAPLTTSRPLAKPMVSPLGAPALSGGGRIVTPASVATLSSCTARRPVTSRLASCSRKPCGKAPAATRVHKVDVSQLQRVPTCPPFLLLMRCIWRMDTSVHQ